MHLLFFPAFYHKAHTLIVNFDFFQSLIVMVIAAGIATTISLQIVPNSGSSISKAIEFSICSGATPIRSFRADM